MYTIQNVQVYNQIGSSCAFLGLARLKITAILSHFGIRFRNHLLELWIMNFELKSILFNGIYF